MNYPDYDTLREEYEAGNITAVDFVLQQSDEVTEGLVTGTRVLHDKA